MHKCKEIAPDWKASQVKNTLLLVALLLEEKKVNLWKLKGSVGKLLGNTQTYSRPTTNDGSDGYGRPPALQRAAIGFVIRLRAGNYQHQIEQHGSPEMSLFRYGLDLWQNHLPGFALFLKQLLSFTSYCNKAEKPLLINNVL